MAMLSMAGGQGLARCITSLHADMRGLSKKNQKEIAEFVEVVIEVPKGSVVKRRPDGSLDFIMPCPCPFNYGSVKSIRALDGDPLDAIVLGGHLPYGHIGTWKVKGMLKFSDAGIVDNKLVCVQPSQQCKCCFDHFVEMELPKAFGLPKAEAAACFQPIHEDLTVLDWLSLSCIFSAYAPFKGCLNAARGMHGVTSFNGWEFYC